MLKVRRELLVCFLLGAVILAIYWPVRNYPFVCYDDNQFVTQNPYVQSGLNLQSIWYAFSGTIAENWHPVTTLSHTLDCDVLGVNPGRHHLVNVALHIANAILLFLLVQRMTGAFWRSAAVAALFALHPLRVESVAWIAERKDVLSGLFFLLTLWAYVRYAQVQSPKSKVQSPKSEVRDQAPQSDQKSALRFYNLALLFFILGLMSKPMLVTVPFVLLLLDLWPLGRVPGISSEIRGRRSEEGAPSSVIHPPSSILHPPLSSLWPLIWEKWRFFALSAVCCVITMRVQREEMGSMSLWDRTSNAIVSYLRYLGKAVWPTDLAVLYPHPGLHYPVSDQWPLWQIAAALLLLVAVSALCICQLRRRPYLAVGWFWYLGTMVPVIGLVQVGAQAMADRYTYLPLIGPVISLVWWVAELGVFEQKETKRTKMGTGKAQSSSFSPFPSVQILLSLVPAIALAVATRHQLNYWRDSIALFEHTLAVTPDNPLARGNLGYAYATDGHPEWAAVQYRVALAIDPRYPQGHFNLAGMYKDKELWAPAVEQYLAVTRIDNDLFMPHLGLAQILPRLGRIKEAVAQMDEALRVYPLTHPESPNNPLPGVLAGALNDLAWGLATDERPERRDGEHAVRFAQRACEMTQYQETVMVGTLAAAYAEANRFNEAVTTAERACGMASQGNNRALLEKNQQLLELYRAGKPWREPAPPLQ